MRRNDGNRTPPNLVSAQRAMSRTTWIEGPPFRSRAPLRPPGRWAARNSIPFGIYQIDVMVYTSFDRSLNDSAREGFKVPEDHAGAPGATG